MAPFSQRRTQEKGFTVHDVAVKLSYLLLISLFNFRSDLCLVVKHFQNVFNSIIKSILFAVFTIVVYVSTLPFKEKFYFTAF